MKNTPVTIWRRQKAQTALLGQGGTIVHWTMIRVTTSGFGKQTPYPVVYVALDTGTKMVGQLVDWENIDLQQGRKVIVVLRRLRTEDTDSVISYYTKFKPA